MPRTARSSPRELATGWPDRASEDPVVETARRFALNVREAIQGRSLREIGSLAGVNHSTIVAIVDGRVWPDLATIAKLEQGLDRSLYPARGQG